MTDWDKKSSYQQNINDPITQLVVNHEYMVTVTKSNQKYIYSRQETSLKYLISKIEIDSFSTVALSPMSNSELLYTQEKIKLYRISSGFLTIKDVTESVEFTLNATSISTTCPVSIKITF